MPFVISALIIFMGLLMTQPRGNPVIIYNQEPRGRIIYKMTDNRIILFGSGETEGPAEATKEGENEISNFTESGTGTDTEMLEQK